MHRHGLYSVLNNVTLIVQEALISNDEGGPNDVGGGGEDDVNHVFNGQLGDSLVDKDNSRLKALIP